MVSKRVVTTPDINSTVQDLVRRNAKLGGENYLDLESGQIIRFEVEKTSGKKKSKK